MQDISTLLSTGTARSIGAAIADGALTSLDAVNWYLDRIAHANHGDDGLNCVRNVSPSARDEARRADAELAAGRCRGPLHGVPYLLKDNVFTLDGSPASAGARALAGFLPPYEATLAGRLRAAGAVLLGKTNLTEFADFVADTMPSEFSGAGGVVRHPHGRRYGRGLGSSVGSAAAVAARFCAFAIGTETQNSIQAPAIHTGVVGFKPSVGAVSRHGIVPLVPSQDAPGVLALCVEDAVLVGQAMAGPDVRDTATLRYQASFSGAEPALRGIRIGVPRQFIADSIAGAACNAAFERTLRALQVAGAVIVDPCDLPSAGQLHEVRSCVFRAEFKDSLNAMLEALRPCGIASMAELIAWNRAHPEAIPYGQSLLEAAHASGGVLGADYRADRRRDIALSVDGGIAAALSGHATDVLLAPMATAAKCTGKAGAPVVALPAGLDEDAQPFGLTVFGMPGADRLVLSVAAGIELALTGRSHRSSQ